jgi:hypothetical protein
MKDNEAQQDLQHASYGFRLPAGTNERMTSQSILRARMSWRILSDEATDSISGSVKLNLPQTPKQSNLGQCRVSFVFDGLKGLRVFDTFTILGLHEQSTRYRLVGSSGAQLLMVRAQDQLTY